MYCNKKKTMKRKNRKNKKTRSKRGGKSLRLKQRGGELGGLAIGGIVAAVLATMVGLGLGASWMTESGPFKPKYQLKPKYQRSEENIAQGNIIREQRAKRRRERDEGHWEEQDRDRLRILQGRFDDYSETTKEEEARREKLLEEDSQSYKEREGLDWPG